MPRLPKHPTPLQLKAAYDGGFLGAPPDPAERDRLEDAGIVQPFATACPHLAGVGAKGRAMLYRSRMKFDRTAYGDEAQTTGDCASKGSTSCFDTTRCVEIDIKGQLEEYVRRAASEPTYGMRGHRGQGMNTGTCVRFMNSHGVLLREDYTDRGGPNLLKYDARIGINWGGRGVPAKVKELIRALGITLRTWIKPKTVEECRDLLMAGYAGTSQQYFACSGREDAKGIDRWKGKWNHNLETAGCDWTEEIFPEPVFFVPQTWGEWRPPNKVWLKHQDVLGPYPTGMMVVSADDYREFLRQGEIYFYADIAGVPAKKLPDYGANSWFPV